MSEPSVMLCTVYRCSKEREMYIYVNRLEGLERIPEELLRHTGTLSEILTLKLHPERRLAEVLHAIEQKGYYLQLPPDKQPIHFTMGE
jgi:uncharacterized protein YcgL (UPF0745 family)